MFCYHKLLRSIKLRPHPNLLPAGEGIATPSPFGRGLGWGSLVRLKKINCANYSKK